MYRHIQPLIIYAFNRECTPDWEVENTDLLVNNFLLVYEGELHILCNNKKHVAKAMDLVYFKKGDNRKMSTDPEKLLKAYCINFQYTFQGVDNYYNVCSNATPLPFETVQSIKDADLYQNLLVLFDELVREWISSEDSQLLLARANFLKIFSLLFYYRFKNNSGRKLDYKNVEMVNEAISFLAEHFSEKNVIKSLVEKYHYGPSYFAKLFKDITEKTPVEMLNTIRLNKAKQLLRDGFSVKETAQLSGFNDIYYFSRYFQKNCRISPHNYKKQLLP